MREKLPAFIILLVTIITLYLVISFTHYFIERSAKESFKKLYTTYSQILEMTVKDFDGNTECYFSIDVNTDNDFSGCQKFYEKFIENLKVAKICKDNSLLNGCLPDYKAYSTEPACEGFSETSMNKTSETFVMQDNSTFTIFNLPANAPKPAFTLDSNGKMIPNKSGYDRFSLVIIRNAKGYFTFHPNVTYCIPTEKNGVHYLQDVYK